MVLGLAALVAAAYLKPDLRLVYNPSDSAPRGWYIVSPVTDFRAGDYVVTRLPNDTATLAASRGYLPRSVPILKQIAAVSGQRVCIRRAVVYIDSIAVAQTLSSDSDHRPLIAWEHCRTLIKDELFLLNPHHEASFDSRYFGPVDVSFVRGRAVPLLRSEHR
jgi:conjugative transfer signal peptidase TraF